MPDAILLICPVLNISAAAVIIVVVVVVVLLIGVVAG